MQVAQSICCYCCSGAVSNVFTYRDPPVGETRFTFSDKNYYREVLCCTSCGHFMSIHEMDDSELYEQDYVNSTYGDDRILSTFERIISLDPKKSDNVGRCNRIVEFANQHFTKSQHDNRPTTILDVGSGLCVFLHRMKALGWLGTALDPDPRAVSHAKEVVGVEAVCGDFCRISNLGRFNVIAFNKVLEHVHDPVAMLAHSAAFLEPSGFVYVELPDGEMAARDGQEREEFFVEHHHVFSLASLGAIAVKSGFTVRLIERLQEPSTKYTLRAFLCLS